MIEKIFFLFFWWTYFVKCVYFDTYNGTEISNEEFEERQKTNRTFWCTIDIAQPCDAYDWRRIDGSCNNLQQPTRGAVHTPTYRVLPPQYRDVDEPRLSKSGEPLPLARFVRTSVLPQGKVPDKVLSQMVSYFSVYVSGDVASLHDTLNYILWKTKCCEPEGKTDRDCVPNYIPDDDPVRRFSDVRCMNLTRPITFQSQKCVQNGTVPVRILSNTPTFDLSSLYGTSMDKLNEVREMKDGLLKQEIENGKIWPPSVKTAASLCLLNQRPRETRCHKIRYNNLVRDGVISRSIGFRDLYNEEIVPKTSLEFLQVMRWFHTVQDAAVKMYDSNGYYLKQFPVVNLTLRTGYLAVDDNIDYITQGSFRQRSAKVDYLIDPDFAELILGPHQKASDVATSDVAKNRLFGLAPYIKYREFCFGEHYQTFDDLIQAMDEERIEILRELYKDLEDIDLMAGIWSERPIKGGFVPQTVYCLFIEQKLRNIHSDRHWYERPNRPHAFTLPQLLEIRKATMAKFLCDVGDKVTRVQPKAFQRPRHGNEIDSCDNLDSIDFYLWEDPTCDARRKPVKTN